MTEEKRGRGRPKKSYTSVELPEYQPQLTTEATMQMMSEAAFKVAYQQLQDGTIAPSTLNKLLDYGTPQNDLKIKQLGSKTALDESKVKMIEAESQEKVGQAEVLERLKGYRGNTFEERQVDNFI